MQTDVEAIYDVYTYLPEMRAAVERWQERFSAIVVSEDTFAKAA